VILGDGIPAITPWSILKVDPTVVAPITIGDRVNVGDMPIATEVAVVADHFLAEPDTLMPATTTPTNFVASASASK
jgi:hypothetical protein